MLFKKHTGIYYQLVKDEVDGATLGQYTGLQDKNDKEIYEGDIIQYSWTEESEELTSNMQIFWNDPTVQFCYDDSSTSDKTSYSELTDEFCKEIVVIGNIYDNPELLKS